MKTRMILAALLLLAFGSVKAQDTIKVTDPERAELQQLMHELGVNLQQLSDSVDWKQFERNMEQWGREMEEWGRKMEEWGDRFEKRFENRFDKPYNNRPRNERNESQVHAITVEGSGNVTVRQSEDGFSVSRSDNGASNQFTVDGNVFFRGSTDYDVVIPQLDRVVLRSSGDVTGVGTIKGSKLDIVVFGSGDLRMDVDYDTINVQIFGSGDVTLSGRCKLLNATLTGSGDLRVGQLQYEKSKISATGSGEVLSNGYRTAASQKNNSGQRPMKKNLLLNAHWNGFEAGLNMLIDPSAMNTYTGPHESMAIRPLRSWYFGFNIADVGIAFNKKHTVGLFTGIGLGWNNYSWKNHIRMTVQDNDLVNELIPDDRPVKNSKFGLLYAQVPLMIEVRPTRSMYIDLGVTGGIRLAAWSRIKYGDGSNEKTYSNYLTNLFKCDASFRIGAENLGFFANYALVPTYVKGRDAAKAHPLMFGFSVNF